MSKKVEKAGIIPFYLQSDQPLMMFMKPSDAAYGGNKFQIAKGHIDPGENPLEAAVRECYEELGLLESNIAWIEKCGIFLNNHHIFIAKMNDKSPKAFADYTEETESVKWMDCEEFYSSGKSEHKRIVKECITHFEHCLKKRG